MRVVLSYSLLLFFTPSLFPKSNGYLITFNQILQNVFGQFGARSSGSDDSISSAVMDSSNSLDSNTVDSPPRVPTKCFGELGCLQITDGWYSLLHRPSNVLPFDRSRINTRFILYTRERVIDPIRVFLSKTNLLESGFQPDKPVKFVVHGYLDSGFVGWINKLSQQLAVVEDANVIVVDWHGGSFGLYGYVVANARVVGLEIAHFAKFLMDEFEMSPENMHIIGHSAGAHVAGYAGEKIPELGRITGLDPAGPYFQHMPHFARLDPTDAKFVDIIHSDGRNIIRAGLGTLQPFGHVDFYPNGGQSQPGCFEEPVSLKSSQGFDDFQRTLVACNHHRAIYFFMESLLSKCQFVGHMCNNYDSYLKGHCDSCGVDGSKCAKIGIDADKYPIRGRSLVQFYLSTSKAFPYCLHHYRVNIQTAYPRNAAPSLTGNLKITVIASLSSATLSGTDDFEIKHGSNIPVFVENPHEFGVIQKIRVEWLQHNNTYRDNESSQLRCWGHSCDNKLFIKRIEVRDIDNIGGRIGKGSEIFSSTASAMCGEEGTKYTGIGSGEVVSLDRPC